MARAVSDNQQWQEAEDLFDLILQDYPDNAHALVEYAYMKKNRFYTDKERHHLDEALALAERAVQAEPDRAGAWNAKTIILRELGRYEEALEASEEATRVNPSYWAALINQGSIRAVLGDLDAAEAALRRGCEIGGDAVDDLPYHNLAAIQLASGDSAAWNTLKIAASRTDRAEPGLMGLRALMRLSIEAHRDDRAALEDAITANGLCGEGHQNAAIHRVLAAARLANEDYVRAAESARRALDISRDAEPLTRLLLAVAAANVGDIEQARQQLAAAEILLQSASLDTAWCVVEGGLLWCHSSAELAALRARANRALDD
ncbi:MAG: tetratricopeptide repeat protein [Planctomycetes bacterium]|nr:tetratricopeptide repeat protein [Planctomycetota bacterium]